jgi:hypothetical protein
MGMHTIQFTWNVTVNEPHKIVVTRIARIWSDILEIELDDRTIASPTAGIIVGLGLGRRSQKILVEDQLMELHWKYSSAGDPESIVLVCDGKMIARYGKTSAVKSLTFTEEIDPGNVIPLSLPAGGASIDYTKWNWLQRLLSKITGQYGSPYLPPAFAKKESVLALDELGRDIGFADEKLATRLAEHGQHLKKWNQLVMLFYLVPAVLTFFLVWWYLSDILFDLLINYDGFMAMFVIFFSTYVLSFLVFTIGQRIAFLLSRKFKIETLPVATIIYMLVELEQEDALIHPEKRHMLLARINYLAQQTLLLGTKIPYKSKNKKNHQWTEKHFRSIEAYLRERERWIHAPIASTQKDLRSDLHRLAKIYISGLYGEFNYQINEYIEPEQHLYGLRPFLQNLAQKLPQIFVGIALPIGLAIVFRDQLLGTEKILFGLDPLAIALFLAAWLALGADTVLNLGFFPNLLNTVKGIRELT